MIFLCVHVLFHEIMLVLLCVDVEECTHRFLNSKDIDETDSMIVAFPNSSRPNTDPLFDFTQWIFPDINFTCDGYIIRWRLRVNVNMESVTEIRPMQRSSPHITTWKLRSEMSFGSNSNYALKSSTNESQINVTVMNGSVYYEYTPSSPIPVQVGDIVGIVMPSVAADRSESAIPLFLSLPEESSDTVSCVRLGISELIILNDRICLEEIEQQSRYIPLVSAIFSELPNYIPLLSYTFSFFFRSCHTFICITAPNCSLYLYSTSHYCCPYTFSYPSNKYSSRHNHRFSNHGFGWSATVRPACWCDSWSSVGSSCASTHCCIGYLPRTPPEETKRTKIVRCPHPTSTTKHGQPCLHW